MTLSLLALLVAAIVGVIVYFICKAIPYVSKDPLPVLLGLLAGALAYLGQFSIVLQSTYHDTPSIYVQFFQGVLTVVILVVVPAVGGYLTGKHRYNKKNNSTKRKKRNK